MHIDKILNYINFYHLDKNYCIYFRARVCVCVCVRVCCIINNNSRNTSVIMPVN